jgi:hypothetical protein
MLLSLKRAGRVLAAITGWLLFNFVLGYLDFVVPSIPYTFAFGADFLEIVFAVVFLSGNLLIIPFCLIYYRHSRRDRWIQEEAERWLAKRSAQSGTPVSIWSGKMRRRLLWLPSLLALTVFLFEPEAMGIVSHIFDRQSHDLNGHLLHTPLTSFVHNQGNLFVSALIGRGIGRVGPLPYMRKSMPISSLFFYGVVNPRLDHYRDWFLTSDNVRSRRTLPFGSETITCADVTSGLDAPGSDLVEIACRSFNNDISADFYGIRDDVNEFYEILTTSTEPPMIPVFRSLPPIVPEK